MGGRYSDDSIFVVIFSVLLGELNKADNGMSSHKTLIVSILGLSLAMINKKAFIGGFGRVQGCSMPNQNKRRNRL